MNLDGDKDAERVIIEAIREQPGLGNVSEERIIEILEKRLERRRQAAREIH